MGEYFRFRSRGGDGEYSEEEVDMPEEIGGEVLDVEVGILPFDLALALGVTEYGCDGEEGALWSCDGAGEDEDVRAMISRRAFL